MTRTGNRRGPDALIRCTRCLMPETMDTIIFDKAGVCNVCRSNEIKHGQIDWKAKGREFEELVNQYRDKYDYDCIVPFSGGKDSTYTLFTLVKEFELKPLVVSFDHGFMRPTVLANRERSQGVGGRPPELSPQLENRSAPHARVSEAKRRLLLALPCGDIRLSNANRHQVQRSLGNLG